MVSLCSDGFLYHLNAGLLLEVFCTNTEKKDGCMEVPEEILEVSLRLKELADKMPSEEHQNSLKIDCSGLINQSL